MSTITADAEKPRQTFSLKFALLFLILGSIVTGALNHVLRDDSAASRVDELTLRVNELELALLKKNAEVMNLRLAKLRPSNADDESPAQLVAQLCKQSDKPLQTVSDTSIPETTPIDSYDVARQLGSHSDTDPRSFSEKVNELMSNNASPNVIAVVSKSVLDMATSDAQLPEGDLEAIYRKQSDPDLKRVVAQALALRGNNELINQYMNSVQPQLSDENALQRQQALQQLAKTHSASAVNLITPLLNDKDINVKLDALLALGATGNQSHLHLIENMVRDSDPAVSILAKDIAQNLRGLSDYARTNLTASDIAAEIPPI